LKIATGCCKIKGHNWDFLLSQIKWTSDYQTSRDFEWTMTLGAPNSLDFSGRLKSRLYTGLFSFAISLCSNDYLYTVLLGRISLVNNWYCKRYSDIFPLVLIQV
jgi:hypothetical protein